MDWLPPAHAQTGARDKFVTKVCALGWESNLQIFDSLAVALRVE